GGKGGQRSDARGGRRSRRPENRGRGGRGARPASRALPGRRRSGGPRGPHLRGSRDRSRLPHRHPALAAVPRPQATVRPSRDLRPGSGASQARDAMKGVHLDSELQDLLDGRADAVVRLEAQDHLRACADCRRRLAALEAVRAAVRAASESAELPPERGERLGGALDREDSTARPRSRPVRLAWLAAGAIAAAALLLIVVFPRGHTPDVVDQVMRQYRVETGALPPRSLRTSDV